MLPFSIVNIKNTPTAPLPRPPTPHGQRHVVCCNGKRWRTWFYTYIDIYLFRSIFVWNGRGSVKIQTLFYGIWYKTKSLEILTRNQKFSKKFRNCNQNVWQHLMLRIYCTRCPRKTTFFDIATARRQCKVVFLTKTTQIYRICCPLWLSREMRQVL